MPRIVTTTAFPVTLDSGEIVSIPAGESEQSQEVADHWFVRAHLVGTPKGVMPLVEGPDGLMIEADEAGQRLLEGANLRLGGVPPEPLRQEGPIDWSNRNPAAVERAKAAAEAADTEHTEAVDGRVAARQLAAERKAGAKPAPRDQGQVATEFSGPAPR